MADAATLQARLTEAEDAFHRLMMGEKEVEVSYEDRTVKYNMTSEANLRRYIAQLKKDLALDVVCRSRRVTY